MRLTVVRGTLTLWMGAPKPTTLSEERSTDDLKHNALQLDKRWP